MFLPVTLPEVYLQALETPQRIQVALPRILSRETENPPDLDSPAQILSLAVKNAPQRNLEPG